MAAKRRREIYLQQMISAIVAEVETSHGNGGKAETLDEEEKEEKLEG